MLTKLRLLFVLAILSIHTVDVMSVEVSSTPDAWYGPAICPTRIPDVQTSTYNIPEADLTCHVTLITLHLLADGAVVGFSFSGGTCTFAQWPNDFVGQTTATHAFTFATTDRISKIDLYVDNVTTGKLYRVDIYRVVGSLQSYNRVPTGLTPKAYTFTIPAGNEFIGFQIWSGGFGCFQTITVHYRAETCVTLDLSQISGHSQKVKTDPAQSKSFSATVTCSYAVEYQVTYTPNSFTPDLITISTDNFGFYFMIFDQATDTADAKQYTVTVNARNTASTDWSTLAGTATATITYTDPCLDATLTFAPLEDMVTSVLVQSSPGGGPGYLIQSVVASDDVSTFLRIPASCQSYVYVISTSQNSAPSALTATELTIDASSGIISLYTENSLAIGTHTATVTVSLPSYQMVPQVMTNFQITIEPCKVTSFIMDALSPAKDKSYKIADAQLDWQITPQTTQVPACGYIQTLTSSTAPALIDLDLVWQDFIDYQAFSRNVPDAGIHQVTITSTLNNYLYDPTPTCSSSFMLTVVDPCLLSTISSIPLSVENLVAFVGYNDTSKVQYVFNDTISISRTLITDFEDFCGEKQLVFTLNGTAATYLTGKNQDFFYFNPPADSTDFGEGEATVQASLVKYPDRKSSIISFTATTLTVIPPTVPNQIYVVNQEQPLYIQNQPFKVIPESYDVGPISLQAFEFEGTELPSVIDFSCECLKNVSDQNWISYNPIESILTVQTADSSFVGNKTIILVQSFENFPDVNPFTSVSIFVQILPVENAPVTVKQVPYFTKNLVDQNVTQCPGENLTMWSFTLPPQIDPNNQTVFISLTYDDKFFTYDEIQTTIKQIKFAQKTSSWVIKITLTNTNAISATYSLNVRFSCDIDSSSQNSLGGKVNQKNFTFIYNTSKETTKVSVKEIVRPKAKIQKIDPTGLVHISFSQKMKVPERPELIETDQIQLNGTYFPILNFTVIPGKFTELSQTKFNWTFVAFTSTELQIQLNFEHLSYISSTNGHPDMIKLTIYGVQYFEDTLANLMFPPTILSQKALPPLASKEAVQEALDQVATTTNTLASVVTMLLISGPVQEVLSSFRHTQITVHLMLIAVNQPATSLVFFGGLMNLVNFQLIDFSNILNKMFRLDADSAGNGPLNSQFELMGYGCLYIIQNFGMLCFTIFAPFAYRLVAPVIIFIGKYSFLRLDYSSLNVRARNWLQYDFWISFLDETYLFLLICSGLNLKNYFAWQKFGDGANTFIALFFGLVLLVFPIFVWIFYSKKQNYELIEKKDEEFTERFGSILQGLNFKRRGRWALLYPCISLLRKMWLAYILVYQMDKPIFNIFCVMIQAQIMMAVSGLVEPMIVVSENRMQLFNEFSVILLAYHFFPLTDFMTNIEMRNLVGQSLMAITLANLAANLFLSAAQNFLRSKEKICLCYRKRKHLREKQEAMRKKKLDLIIKTIVQQSITAEIEALRQKNNINDTQGDQGQESATNAVQIQQNTSIERVKADQIELQDRNPHHQSPENQIKQPVNLLMSRLDLLYASFKYTKPDLPEQELSEKQRWQCKRIVEKNQLGIDLRPLGRIQGPIPAVTRFQNKREVVFVFNRPLQDNDLWDRQKQHRMAQAAVELRAGSNSQAKDQFSADFANGRLNSNFKQTGGGRIAISQGQEQTARNMTNDPLPVLLERDESLEELNKKFPGLVKEKILLTLTSEFRQKTIKIYMIKVDVELVRFGMLVDGVDLQQVLNQNGQNSEFVETQLIGLLKSANKLACDFPKTVHDDIISGRFAMRMLRYQRQRNGIRPELFKDFGEVPDDMDFEQLVLKYEKICRHDDQSYRIQQMLEQRKFL